MILSVALVDAMIKDGDIIAVGFADTCVCYG